MPPSKYIKGPHKKVGGKKVKQFNQKAYSKTHKKVFGLNTKAHKEDMGKM